MTPVETFGFRFSAPYRLPGLLFGIAPHTARVTVRGDRLQIRFGPWWLQSDLVNILHAEITGPYRFIKAAGPARLSLADGGITFATNGDRGVCIRFRTPVSAMDPLRILRHPAVTVTVADTQRLTARLVS